MKQVYLFTFIFLCLLQSRGFAQITLDTPNTETVLYLGEGKGQPLLVGLGGSEGGNAWTSDRWKPVRDSFIAKGYAFVAIGYFAAKGTPVALDQIAIEDVHNAILAATKNKNVDGSRIAIIGGSRGGDLALLLGSYYPDINCVVGIVSSHAVFPGHTLHFKSSCWTYAGKELPYIPLNKEAVPSLMKRDLRGAFDMMLKDTAAEAKALIPVEKIQGPVLLLSATQDEICPSTPMGEKMMARFKAYRFKYPFEHIAVTGSHAAPLKDFSPVFAFLQKNFPVKK